MFNILSDFYNGKILLIEKPWGWTSFEVVKKVKNFFLKKTGKKIKIGHAGTLDPLATGLLIVLTGKETKKTNLIHNLKKSYTGIIKLGCETLSSDSETMEQNFSSISHITSELVKNISKKFVGEINQIPPIFSALKIHGKKYYKYARKKEKINIKSRKIQIFKFDLITIKIPYIKFFIECGKGTYIRSLARDIGISLKSRAYLLSLRREKIGFFSIKNPFLTKKIFKEFEFLCYVLTNHHFFL